jgi:hypothetical protein
MTTAGGVSKVNVHFWESYAALGILCCGGLNFASVEILILLSSEVFVAASQAS